MKYVSNCEVLEFLKSLLRSGHVSISLQTDFLFISASSGGSVTNCEREVRKGSGGSTKRGYERVIWVEVERRKEGKSELKKRAGTKNILERKKTKKEGEGKQGREEDQ